MQIPLSNGGFTEIDDEDEPLAEAFKWRRMVDYRKAGRSEYVVTMPSPGVNLFLHRLIMRAAPNQRVDHKDGNGLNNRRSNLRFATQSQNLANRTHSNRAASGFRGVYAQGTRWKAAIAKEGGWHGIRSLGVFESKEEAARAYDKAATERWGEFARLNFPVTVNTDVTITCYQ